jgi:arylsulfatase A-like enzyme
MVLALACAAGAAAPEKPNIIFILSDDVGIGNVSCYADLKAQDTADAARVKKAGKKKKPAAK